MLVRINEASEMGLIVVLAACHGIHLARTLVPTDRSPVWGFIGPDDQVLPSDITRGFRAFYTTLFSSLDLTAAIRALKNADASNPETWKFQNAELFFAYMFGEYLRLYGSPDQQRRQNEEIMANLIVSDRFSSDQLRAIRASLGSPADEFGRLKQTFLMLDLFPENAPRFPITRAEAIDLHAHIARAEAEGG
jgi:hypothetical protein